MRTPDPASHIINGGISNGASNMVKAMKSRLIGGTISSKKVSPARAAEKRWRLPSATKIVVCYFSLLVSPEVLECQPSRRFQSHYSTSRKP